MLFGSLEQPIIQSDTITDRGCFMNLTVTRFYFHPILIDGRRLESCRDEFHRFQLFRASVFIYVYGWKKRKDPTMEFFFFSIPLFFQLVVIFVIFLRKSDRATGSYFLSHLGREYDR